MKKSRLQDFQLLTGVAGRRGVGDAELPGDDQAWLGPMPGLSRPPDSGCTVSASVAITTGWRR
jgi:hypothetical protein